MNPVAHLKAQQGPCPACGKQCYRSRRGARAAGRLLYPNRRTYAYRCGAYWHLTSTIVRLGRAA
jgi:hypothetical protein